MDSAGNTCSARRACSGRASAGDEGQSATNGQVLSTYTSLRERRIYASHAAVQRQAKV